MNINNGLWTVEEYVFLLQPELLSFCNKGLFVVQRGPEGEGENGLSSFAICLHQTILSYDLSKLVNVAILYKNM